LQRSVQRKEEQIKSMKHLFDELKEKYVSDTDALSMLSREFEGMSLDLFQNEIKNNSRSASGRRYSEEVKKFAVTLFYNSPKAYDYCRRILNLPHPSSIRHWHSSVNAEPGFHKEIISFLKNLSSENKDCNMIFDGMSIRQQLLWSEQEGKLVGYVDYGNDIHIEGKDSLANESLVFMLVVLNGKWKWPIAYFLKKSLSAATLAELILTALSLTSNSELKIRSITCDGATVNISALNKLGCSIYVNNYESIVNSFKHPTRDYNVYVILDACHMLKLARNALADFKEFRTDDGNIEWRYIIQLYQLQNQLTFRFKNKLNSQCINWWQNKMKVKYAAQTLSSSVATAIEFLKQYCPEFHDSEATITFIKAIDRLFDFMNSRNPFGIGFHAPITRNNFNALEAIIIEKISYLFLLKTKTGDMLCMSGRRTFICGMATTVKSILAVAKEIFSERESFKYILTYKFSQDYLEIFFSKIRSRHGYNNNPNVLQFKYAMRQILLRNEIKGSPNSNCLHLDSDPTGTMYQFIWKKKKQQNAIFESIDDESDNEIETFNNYSLSNYGTLKENILFYIAGYIIKKLLSQIDCYTCAINLQKQRSDHNYVHSSIYSK
ncbi:THAP domain-containing protein 9, partial [Camponotus floridanus]